MCRFPRCVLEPLLCLLILVYGAVPLHAQDHEPSLEATANPENAGIDPDWQFTLRPYLFLSGVSGSVTVDPLTFPINSSFSSLLDNVRMGLFVTFFAEKHKWGLYADFQYIKLYGEGSGSIPSSLELENLIGEVDLTFRPPAAPTLRFFGGLRVYEVTQTVTVSGNVLDPARTTVVDPVIGTRGSWRLGNHWTYEMRGDIGGFGLSSEFTYQLLMLFRWDISHTVSVPFGYRILGYQIRKSSVRMNYRMSGLMLGLDFRF